MPFKGSRGSRQTSHLCSVNYLNVYLIIELVDADVLQIAHFYYVGMRSCPSNGHWSFEAGVRRGGTEFHLTLQRHQPLTH